MGALVTVGTMLDIMPIFPRFHTMFMLGHLYLGLGPTFSVEEFRQNNAYANRTRIERIAVNLRKAGLK